jgi:putative flippase GtrA
MRLARFGLVGLTTTGLTYVVFRVGLGLKLHYLIASTLSWMAALALSYPLNRRFTFAAGGAANFLEGVRFACGGVLQFLIGQALYVLMIGMLRLDPTLAFVLNVGVGCVVNFSYMRWVVFTSPPDLSAAEQGV